MEKSSRVAVVRLDEKWSDLGNFDAMYDEYDEKQACYSAHHMLTTGKNVEYVGLCW